MANSTIPRWNVLDGEVVSSRVEAQGRMKGHEFAAALRTEDGRGLPYPAAEPKGTAAEGAGSGKDEGIEDETGMDHIRPRPLPPWAIEKD